MIRRVSDRYWCGGTSRLSGAGLFLNTRPARSNVEPWQGHRKPPCQSSGSEGCGPACSRSVGEQPRCVQMPTPTHKSGLIERCSFFAYSGVGNALRSELGSATSESVFFSDSSISGVRLRIHTGLPRHSTVTFSPGLSDEMSTSTGAPAALARSEGWKLATKGTAVNAAPAAPAQVDAINHVRLLVSAGVSLMKSSKGRACGRSTRDCSGAYRCESSPSAALGPRLADTAGLARRREMAILK